MNKVKIHFSKKVDGLGEYVLSCSKEERLIRTHGSTNYIYCPVCGGKTET